MKALLRVALVIVAVLLAYQLIRQLAWTPGSFTRANLDDALAVADKINADISKEELDEYLAQATKDGKVDSEKLRELLLRAAKRAKDIERLHDEAAAVAGRSKPVKPASVAPQPVAEATVTRQPVVTTSPPARTLPEPPADPAPPQPEQPQEVGPTLRPYGPVPTRVDAKQTGWKTLAPPYPAGGSFHLQVKGAITPPIADSNTGEFEHQEFPGGYQLAFPNYPRFALLVRLCNQGICGSIQTVDAFTGDISICNFERPFDRIEVWYNEYYRDAAANQRVPTAETFERNAGFYEVTPANGSGLGSCMVKRNRMYRGAGAGLGVR